MPALSITVFLAYPFVRLLSEFSNLYTAYVLDFLCMLSFVRNLLVDYGTPLFGCNVSSVSALSSLSIWDGIKGV